jgi:hypothetical protein
MIESGSNREKSTNKRKVIKTQEKMDRSQGATKVSKETIHQGKERRKHMERTNRREVRVQEKGTNEQGATKA